jgi:hypothetical protein
MFRKTLPVFFLVLTLWSSCKKEETPDHNHDPISTSGTAAIHVENVVGTEALQLGVMQYKNASADSFQVDLLKYYISNFEWIRDDGTSYKSRNYQLINASNVSSLDFQLDQIPNGTYTGLKFYLGVDSLSNHTLTNSAALDASSGMIWNWNTGYIFFKHEGKYVDSTGVHQPLLFHFGTDRALAEVTLPLNNLVFNSNSRNVVLKLDLASLYGSPNAIDFNIWHNNQSLTTQEFPWLDAMKQNFSSSFYVSIP